MTPRSTIIIGAGIGGLSTGRYARMNGYWTTILEKQDKPGGCCMSWKRKGYIFDYCIHDLSATAPHSKTRMVWDELGAFRGAKTLGFREAVQVESEEGKVLTVHADVQKLHQQMLEIAPNDRKPIDDYIKGPQKFSGFDLHTMMMGGIGPKLILLRYRAP